MAAGGTYWVGEHGPEAVTFPADGYVSPAGSGGGTQTIQIAALCPACLRQEMLATIGANGRVISQSVAQYHRGRR